MPQTEVIVQDAEPTEATRAPPLAYALAVPLPEQDETYTFACVPTIIAGCAKDD